MLFLREALVIELKRRAAYVASFWLKMIVPPLAQVVIAYFLWGAVYESQGVTEIGGYTFPQMILYYILISCAFQMTRPDMGMILMEIYEGTLTKFLVYPTSFLAFKFSGQLANMALVGIQLIIAIFLFSVFVPLSQALSFEWSNIILSVTALLMAGFLFFMMMACVELLSFWLESAWALCIMLEFVVNLFGGKIVPLDLFPEWLRGLTDFLPFRYLLSFPVEILQGKVSGVALGLGMGISLLWCLVFAFLARFIWQKGSFHYTGTGM